MRREYERKTDKRGGQVRGERKNTATKAPVYTASYKVNYSDTLLEFLLKKCNTSRNNVKALLAKRQVLVGGSVVTQFDFPLAKDDEVKIAKSPVQGTAVQTRKATPKTERIAKARVARVGLKIIYEDEDLIAIDKPAGLLSVESDKDTESAYLYVSEYLAAQGKNVRPYVLHRIDKETSGVLVFAKNIKLHSMLKMHWNEAVSLREYYAVAEGVFEQKEGEIISYLKENKNNLMYSTQDPSGQRAVTQYQVQKETTEYTLLRVCIQTGRKNQIRVHLKDKGHAIVGDDKYGHTKNPLKRLGLHASALEFMHPITKELMTFRAPLPAAFRELFS